MKLFAKIRMQSEFNTAMLFDGVELDAAGTSTGIPDGSVVTILDPVAHNLYPTVKDLNASEIQLGVQTGGIVGFVDYVDVNMTKVQGVDYRIGDKVANMTVPAGVHTRVRLVQVGDEFYLGDENFAAAPVVGTTYKGADATGKLDTTGTSFEIKVLDEKQMIQGSVNNGNLYRCRRIA